MKTNYNIFGAVIAAIQSQRTYTMLMRVTLLVTILGVTGCLCH